MRQLATWSVGIGITDEPIDRVVAGATAKEHE